jgi:hypothetical protein
MRCSHAVIGNEIDQAFIPHRRTIFILCGLAEVNVLVSISLLQGVAVSMTGQGQALFPDFSSGVKMAAA